MAYYLTSRLIIEKQYARLIALMIRTSTNTFAAEHMGRYFAEDSALAFLDQFPNTLTRYLFGFFEYRIQKFQSSVYVLHPESVTTQEEYFKYMDNFMAFFAGMRMRTKEMLEERKDKE